jgi:dTMP kinase
MTSFTGRFITVEGVEGAGKSTNIAYLCDCLEAAGIDYIATREPGGTPLAESIRDMLLHCDSEDVDGTAELLLIFAARAQHLAQLIRPTLAAGKWVVCDRFTDATYAYQGGARGLGTEKVKALESLVQGDLRPDRTFFLDLPVDQGMQRVEGRGDLDRFEREKISFFETVKSSYHQLIAGNPDRYAVIDASLPLEQVQRQIKLEIDKMLEGL